MIDREKITEVVEDIIDTLTFRRVALLTLLAIISVVLFSLFENRNALFASIYKTTTPTTLIEWDLSNDSKDQLKGLVSSINYVGAVLMTDVDLKKNRRVTKWYYVEDKILSEEIKLTAAGILPQALFDYDPKNTEQMVAMLDNEFRCTDTKDTVFVRFFPNFPDRFPQVCRLAVPPFFGEFAGFMTIFVTRRIKPEEYDALKIEVSRVAIEIYLRDISKKPKN